MFTITIKETFFAENELIVNIKIWKNRRRVQGHDI